MKAQKKITYKTNLKIGFLLICILLFLLSLSTFSPIPNTLKNPQQKTIEKTFWRYQCFDTMKTSRDKAREWREDPKLEQLIEKEMKAIAELGGNCVAIATPYDPEFLPVLRLWVEKARKYYLAIWFRGNFSSWEGWFNYPKGMTIEQHHQKTKTFIERNANLFEDGDIFTPSPEAENGGPFNQVEVDEHEAFREYLIEEYEIAKNSFAKINKRVEVNWLSMNGGLGKRMFDQQTVDGIGGVVTIDHYIKTAEEMGEFISYFKNNFNAKLVIGEFGAPIPEINGPMSEQQQAEFIDQLFAQLVAHKTDVIGINYWTLWDGSAALYNPDWTPRQAVNVVKKYMKPAIISGQIINTKDDPIANVLIKTSDQKYQATTDQNGNYELLLPAGTYDLEVSHQDYVTQNEKIILTLADSQTKVFALIPKDQDLWYQLNNKLNDLQTIIQE